MAAGDFCELNVGEDEAVDGRFCKEVLHEGVDLGCSRGGGGVL